MFDYSRIRELRKASGLSAFELSVLTRVQPSYISKLEKGMIPNVGVETLNKLLSVMGYRLEIVEEEGLDGRGRD